MAVKGYALMDIFRKQYPEFSYCSLEKNRPDGEVKGIRILLPEEKLQEGYFYIGSPEQVNSRLAETEDLWMVSVPGEPADKSENVLSASENVGYVLNAFCSSYDIISNWEREVDISLAKGSSPQQILTMSADLIELAILVYDPSMKLLGYVNAKSENNPYFQDIVQKGYLTQDIFAAVSSAHMFENLEKDSETIINAAEQPSGNYATVKLIRNLQVPIGYVFVIHEEFDQIEAYRGILNMLCEKIKVSLEKANPVLQRQNYLYEYFLVDILNETLTDPKDIAVRFRYLGIPEGKNYVLLNLCFKKDARSPLGYFSSMIKNVVQQCYLFHFEKKAYMILHLEKGNGEAEREEKLKIIDPFLKQFDCVAIASDCFDQLLELPRIRVQTDLAERVYEMGLAEPVSGNVIRNEDCRIQRMLLLCLENASSETWINQALKRMAADDEQRRVKYINLLKVYWEENCEVGKAAERLFMHRSNVTYHLGRIKERYGLDVGKSGQLFDIVWSLTLMEFAGKM